jgi:hydrogenase maturation protease
MTDQHILIAGIGNIFLGDDAFGVEVAQRMAARRPRDGVRVVDFGIRGFDLAYAILDGPDLTIMVDASQRGEQPGTLYVIEPAWEELAEPGAQAIETHAMTPLRVLQLVKTLGGEPPRVLVVGCEPATLESDDGHIGLSAPVQAAVDEAINLITSLVDKNLGESRVVGQG